ncbi:MAG: DNA-binding transcriptional regulator Fis [Gammaproteobacteria bacterium]|nr:DNA-binding transcriptional regulator Fis [Gammaproteobacteria bacterium]
MSDHQCGSPLNGCVRKALDNYFNDLGDHPAGELYQLILSEMEQPLLEKVMQEARGNQTRAAEILGINRGTLRKKLVQYSLDK